ncbi:iron-sulfur cluster repair di-iron protein [Wenyingzhuangia aestuarii]|uniref:iron-sulfur cluster repair di-iron protein n=1 Tax=Wenyingzhuangia aestuarii TaxID=1647582 RepID=UPI0014395D15|nr:iron-sulfur cluster repair di-iron protein [Wenyingzhuangia aestuarii]NJB81530.1 regulator of cell morphogenesis and NO signaling [Wenyingzhuangia aestuarii]
MILAHQIIGELVAQNYRTASVFKAHKIDFCCNGDRTIAQACEKKRLNVKKILEELNNLPNSNVDHITDFQSWDLDLLADYIQKKHHRYVVAKIPEISQYLKKVATVHGQHHPELLEIRDLFLASAEELTAHMQKEEAIVFPFAKQIAMVKGNPIEKPFFETLENPIDCMKHEHDNEGERFRKIAALSNDYTPPKEACNTYKVVFAMLKEFEEDLHMHIHLENNILFPKAIALEKEIEYV